MKSSFKINDKIVTRHNFINFIKKNTSYQKDMLRSYLNKLFNIKSEWKLIAEKEYDWYLYQFDNCVITLNHQHYDIVNMWISKAFEEKKISNYNFGYRKI